MREFYRVLKPRGRALISVWSAKHRRIKGKGKKQKISWNVSDKKLIRDYYIYNLDELKDLIRKAGFKIIKIFEEDNIFVKIEK